VNKKRTSKFRQGIFNIKNKEKYKGTFPIYYRSAWECKCMTMFDHNPNIISWGSESIIVPYQNPITGRVSRYFVDFNITMRDKEGNLKKFLIEIKPHSQTLPPVKTKNIKASVRRQAEYIKNQAKWKAAEQWSVNKGYQFVVLTEKHLKI